MLGSDAPLRHIGSEDIAAHVDAAVAIAAARRSAQAHASGAVQVRRSSIPVGEGGWMRLMSAVVPSLGVFGYKEFHLCGGSVRYAVHVFDIGTGRPLGIVDAALVTTLRTAATAAVAVRCLVRKEGPLRLGVVGTGAEALAGVRALHEVIAIESVRATSRSAENRERFVDGVVAATGLPAVACGSVEAALEDVDVVYVATNSGGRIVLGEQDVAAVPLVASIGSTLPAQRELAGAVLAGADRVVVDTLDVLEESGDAIEARGRGWSADSVTLLGDALREPPVLDPGARVVYKSIGSPEQDLVLAATIIELAAARGFGREIEPLAAVKVNL